MTAALTVQDLESCIRRVAALTYGNFRRWVTADDVEQELRLYALVPPGSRQFTKWAEQEDGEWRTMRALFGAARQYAEREKAVQSGYEVEDVAWYSPSKLAALIPLALDPNWDGLTGEDEEPGQPGGSAPAFEGGTLLAMVADVRAALGSAMDWATVQDFALDDELGMERLVGLADKLGGEFPDAPGYRRGRRAISNAAAHKITGGTY